MSLLSDLNDKIKRLSTRVAEEFKLHQLAINARVATVNGIGPDENGNVEIQTGASLPLGWEYTRLVSDSAPKGGVDYLGQEGTREFYADLWNYVNTEHPDRVISEDDWQAMYSAQNGNVPYYSTGDGSTTFRFPRVVSYLRAGDTAGQYTAEGLPNITGNFNPYGEGTVTSNGAFYIIPSTEPGWGTTTGIDNDNALVGFDASRSSALYGASDHVTPETITVVMGVIAFGEVQSIGTATEEGIVADLGYLEGSVNAIRQDYVKKSGDTMTGLLTNSSGYVAGLSDTPAQFRAVNNDYGFLIRNDGDNTYFLLTAAGDPNGSWDTNSVKLFRINHAELKVIMPDGAWLGNGKIWVA